MTAAEFKVQHPAVAAELAQEAVTQERDRVGAYLVFHDADPEGVVKGIKDGAAISATAMADFNRKAMAKGTLATLNGDNAPTVTTGEVSSQPQSDFATAAFNAEVDAALGRKTA